MTGAAFSTGQLVILIGIFGAYVMAWIGRR
jgi:hypothetical protein